MYGDVFPTVREVGSQLLQLSVMNPTQRLRMMRVVIRTTTLTIRPLTLSRQKGAQQLMGTDAGIRYDPRMFRSLPRTSSGVGRCPQAYHSIARIVAAVSSITDEATRPANRIF